jgi:antitoxin (DNA-binding transcriptional repressor) of toxin-antitoxin stability system
MSPKMTHRKKSVGIERKSRKQLSVREVRAALSELEEILEREGEVIIARRGEPIARLLPVVVKRKTPSHASLRNETPVLRNSQDLIREERDER